MAFEKYILAPYSTGLETDKDPWLLPQDAFTVLRNAYVFRDRIRKGYGSQWLNDDPLGTRLRVNIGTTDPVTGDFSGTASGSVFEIGQMFSIGTTVFTVHQNGSMFSTGSATGTFNTTTGAVSITGNNENPSTSIYFYPSQPVMGIYLAETSAINNEITLGFDPQFSYLIQGDAWERLDSSTTWSGTNSDFFWGSNYRGSTDDVTLFFVTNNVNNIRYVPTAGISSSSSWTNLNPSTQSSGTNTLDSGLIVLPFKDRLIALNTLETVSGSGNLRFSNRCRYSQNGSPLASDAWHQDVGGKGGFVDAPTKEAIVSAAFYKDRLMVYFESSTWELVYTANEVLPFRWQQINSELGAESTFSRVTFDEGIIGVGNVGVHICNGQTIKRIDQKIPNEVWSIHNGNDGPKRVYGIRDYYNELIYWSFPTFTDDRTFPSQMLVYNYREGSWAFFDQAYTCFGYHFKLNDWTWATLPFATWDEWREPWNTGISQSGTLQVMAGNQQGWTVLIGQFKTSVEPNLYITNISGSTFTVINHGLESGDYIYIVGESGDEWDEEIVQITRIDSDSFTVDTTYAQSYSGNAKCVKVPELDIETKRFNPYISQGKNVFIQKVDFYVSATSQGEFSLDYSTSSAPPFFLSTASDAGALLGSNVLETTPYSSIPLEEISEKLWHPFYLFAEGETILIKLYFSDDQMRNPDIALRSDFALHAMILHLMPVGRLQ